MKMLIAKALSALILLLMILVDERANGKTGFLRTIIKTAKTISRTQDTFKNSFLKSFSETGLFGQQRAFVAPSFSFAGASMGLKDQISQDSRSIGLMD